MHLSSKPVHVIAFAHGQPERGAEPATREPRSVFPLNATGGVTSNENSNSLGGPEQLTTINGSQKAQVGTVNFQLDGGNNTAGLRGTGNPAPNPEAVQEFRVITNNFSAEYGRYPAGVIDVITKSGTNQLHGAAFEFFRDESLNAKRWAPPGTPSTKDPLDRNQYGRRNRRARSAETGRSSSPATRGCGRTKRSTGTLPSCPPRSNARETSHSRP